MNDPNQRCPYESPEGWTCARPLTVLRHAHRRYGEYNPALPMAPTFNHGTDWQFLRSMARDYEMVTGDSTRLYGIAATLEGISPVQPGPTTVDAACPACGGRSLYVSHAGVIWCAEMGCGNPDAAMLLLAPDPRPDSDYEQIREMWVSSDGRQIALSGTTVPGYDAATPHLLREYGWSVGWVGEAWVVSRDLQSLRGPH